MKKTSLYNQHIELKAKMVDFGGFNMPIQYEGISYEHLNVRSNVGIFDVSHMGEFFVDGDESTIDSIRSSKYGELYNIDSCVKTTPFGFPVDPEVNNI